MNKTLEYHLCALHLCNAFSTKAGKQVDIIAAKAKRRIKATNLSKDVGLKESSSNDIPRKGVLKPLGSTPRWTIETLDKGQLDSTGHMIGTIKKREEPKDRSAPAVILIEKSHHFSLDRIETSLPSRPNPKV
jgi:hypothetical protein